MESIILNRKPNYTDKNGNEIIDITKKSVDYKDDFIEVDNKYYCPLDSEMRPDLLTYAA